MKIQGMLVNVTISQWAARKHDARVTAEVHNSHHASADSGRYHKQLIAKKSLAEITAAIGELRTWNYSQTSPWFDNGPRILANNNFVEHTNGWRSRAQKLDVILGRFLSAYPDMVEDERARLNGMYDPADYPSVAKLRQMFQWHVTYMEIPTTPDWRIDVADSVAAELYAQAQAESEKRLQDAIENACGEVWRRIAKVVGHMSQKLGAYSVDGATGEKNGIFRDSLVTNITELCDLLPRLNFSADPAIDAIVTEMRTKLTIESPETLRVSDSIRASVKADADAILAKVSAYF